MPRESTAKASRFSRLTDDEAVTLRRIAFGQSEVRSLRREDVDRLLALVLIAKSTNGMSLTTSGKEHFDALPRSLFATNLRQHNGW